MNTIKELPQNLINKIAAGEVVERPASVLKELLENAIDAGAKNITVKIKMGGVKEITVEDDGKGIPREDIQLAFTRHATSKIQNVEDLMNILSFGFRGEALSSISSVADIEIHTYNEDSKPSFASFNNQDNIEIETKPRTKGTTISVLDLFKTIPARKAFLSSESTEFRHINETFTAIALANPKVNFKLIKDGKEYRNLKESTVYDRIIELFGDKYDGKLIQVFFDSPELKINGYLVHPELAHDRNPDQYLFLNSRHIIERSVIAAIKEGFKNTIPRERKPGYFIFIEIPPEIVDVNVHPRKTEVRIKKGTNLYAPVKNTVSNALDKHLKNELRDRFEHKDFDPVDVDPQITDDKISIQPKPLQKEKMYEKLNLKPNRNTPEYKPKKSMVNQSLKFTQSVLKQEYKPQYIYLDQIFRTYLIYQIDDKILFIDQHAADERVKHERIEKLLTKDGVTHQSLLTPYVFETNKIQELTDSLDSLLEMGIEISQIRDNTFQLSAIPEFMGRTDYQSLVDAILTDLENEGSGLQLSTIQNKLIATIACHSSIRAGDIINRDQAQKLIKDLMACDTPYSCPHGRPIIWEQSKSEIAKNFERNK